MNYLMLNKTDRDGLLSDLEAMPDFLEASFKSIVKLNTGIPAIYEGFSPAEHCWHLADLEREGYADRIRRLREEENPFLPDFDGTQIAKERNYKSLSLAEGLNAFRAARLRNVAILRDLDAGGWMRRGEQEGVGAITLCDIPAMMKAHDSAHRQEIEAWERSCRKG